MQNVVTIDDTMTLDEKLAAIDAALANNQANPVWVEGIEQQAPVDPAELTMCMGCQ